MTIEAQCVAIEMPPRIKHNADWSRFPKPWNTLGPIMAEEIRDRITLDLVTKLEREAQQRGERPSI